MLDSENFAPIVLQRINGCGNPQSQFHIPLFKNISSESIILIKANINAPPKHRSPKSILLFSQLPIQWQESEYGRV